MRVWSLDWCYQQALIKVQSYFLHFWTYLLIVPLIPMLHDFWLVMIICQILPLENLKLTDRYVQVSYTWATDHLNQKETLNQMSDFLCHLLFLLSLVFISLWNDSSILLCVPNNRINQREERMRMRTTLGIWQGGFGELW